MRYRVPVNDGIAVKTSIVYVKLVLWFSCLCTKWGDCTKKYWAVSSLSPYTLAGALEIPKCLFHL